ncbi:hypothetical protein [Nocardiopsis sp. ATB16-24]|nr:hypothetical protein [Nocardiopsis sp. ATB16-24]
MHVATDREYTVSDGPFAERDVCVVEAVTEDIPEVPVPDGHEPRDDRAAR